MVDTVELGVAVQGSVPWEGVKILVFRFHPGFDSLEGLLPLLRFTPKHKVLVQFGTPL